MTYSRFTFAKYLFAFALALVALAWVLLLLPTPVVHAAPVTVTVDTTTDDNAAGFQICSGSAGDCSLRGAITKANTDITNTYTIIVPAGTYSLTIAGTNEHNNANGDLDIKTSLVISGAGAGSATINGNSSVTGERVFHNTGAFTITISGVTITGGNPDGGGLYNALGGTATITSSTFTANLCANGGGAIVNDGTISIANSTFTNGCAGGSAGALYNGSGAQMSVTNSTLSNNSACTGGAIYNAGTLTITASTFSNNSANCGSRYGGAIHNDGGTVTLNGANTLFGNTADYGGAIANLNFSGTGTMTINSGTVITNNTSTLSGAGIYNQNTMMILGSTIISNTTTSGGGGGIFNTDPASFLSLANTAVISNTSKGTSGGGAGLYNYRGTVAIYTSTISLNTATSARGGGIFTFQGSVVITSSAIISNATNGGVGLGDGGGIYNSGGDLIVRNSTLSGNAAKDYGGGIYSAGSTTLSYATITNNTADNDNNGTGNQGGVSAAYTVTMRSTIISGNFDTGGEWPNCSGGFVSLDYNLIGDDGVTCNFPAQPNDLQNTAAMLAPLANNGGSTLTHALLPGSPAMDKIPSGTNLCGTIVTFDQRGWLRPIDGEGDGTARCDIGAYEAPATIFLPLILR